MTIPLLLHSSLNRDKGPCQVGRKRPGHRRLRAGLAWTTFPLVKTLGPRSARGRQPSGPRRQVRGDFARPAAQSRTAHILKDRQPPLSRIDSNFLKRESADSMNQALPGERVAAPARNIHLQNNSFSRSELSANTLAGSPGTREEGGTGLGRRRLSTDLHSPPLSPTPALRDPEVAEAVPDTRAPLCCSRGTRSREAHSAGGSHGGARRTRRSRSRPGVRGGDKCQSRRPGARLDRPEDGAPSPARVLTTRGVATRRAQRPLAARARLRSPRRRCSPPPARKSR